MPVDTHDDIMPATGVSAPNVVETHEDIKPAMGLMAYHGSPHEFNRFDITKIGTGEGAQAYGHGLYFAENEDVAKKYRDDLAKFANMKIPAYRSAQDWLDQWDNPQQARDEIDNSIREFRAQGRDKLAQEYEAMRDQLDNPSKGHMYEVRLNMGPEHLLDWDKPLREQPAYQAVRKHWDDKVGDPDIISSRFGLEEDSTGRDLYEALGGARRSAENASKALSEMGLRGIRYLDAGSRGKDGQTGSHNIVVFDPQHIDVKRRYASGGGIKAYFMHAPHEFGERLQRAFGGAITPVELRGGDFDDEARRLILWSYAAAPIMRPLSREDGGRTYPVAMPTEIKEDLKAGKAKLRKLSPQEFLDESDPLHIGKGDRHIINSFKSHIKSGDPLGPLKLYEEGHQDGRHRANAAKALGIKTVPVVDYRKASGGPVDDAQNAVDIARNLTPMGFYSAAAEAASKIPQRAPIDQIINKLKGSPNVKGEELDWSGVRDAFAGQKSVDPAQVAQHLQANLPQIQETVYGYDSKTKRKTNVKPRYEEYSTPGGQNYREVLLHLPEQDNGDYQSNHWGVAHDRPAVKNVVAHLRMSDRGMKGLGNPEALHIEEVQSDWGQSGRDSGFRKAGELGRLNPDEEAEYYRLQGMAGSDRTEKQQDRLDELLNRWNTRHEKVPLGPHVTSTEGWTDLALKRALREAAQGKYTKLTWTPGEEQAERYGLDKSFSQIHYSPDTKHLFAKGKGDVDDINMNVHEGALPGFIGKELAEKLLARPAIDNTQPLVKGDTVKSLIGGQLAVPQKGMRDFYDRMIPNRLQKLVSKLDPDAKVQLYGHKIDVPGENYPSDANDWQGDEDDWDFKKVHSLEITPKLRAAILKGLPAYETGGSVLKRAFKVLSQYPR